MQKRLALSALALSLALPTAHAGGMAGMPMGPVTTAQVSNDSTVLFMESISMSNLTEIKTSQLALQKSSNPQIRAFAQKMITDHTKAQNELKNLAAMKGIRITDQPGADQRLLYNKLTRLSGAQFDAMYKMVQVSGHEMTLTLIKTYRDIGGDADALAYAAKVQPVIVNHLEMAKMLPGS